MNREITRSLTRQPDATLVHSTTPTIQPTKGETFRKGYQAAIKFILTPLGFLFVIYGLNVIAWGGMLFLLLCGAAPAMCHPSCNDINSPRRKWIEIDSQILTALFCVPAFGFAPWRFRDLWYLLVWRLGFRGQAKRIEALRRLAGFHNSWFRLPGSENILEATENDVDSKAVPIPLSAAPPAPATGVRARPTKLWLMDLEVWCFVWNTLFQAILCGFMWAYNRYVFPRLNTLCKD